WPRTSSSGRRSCSITPRSRPSCSRRSSAARAWRAGARTSSSRSARRASSARPRSTSARRRGRSPRCWPPSRATDPGRGASAARKSRCRGPPPSRYRLLRARHRLAEQVAQQHLLLGREALERLGRLLHARLDAAAQVLAGLGDDEHLHAAVVGGRPPLDEPARLEAVDDAGDVRVVAGKRLGELAHRQRVLGIERLERPELGGREVELRGDGQKARALRGEKLGDERPSLAGGRSLECLHATYGTCPRTWLPTSTFLLACRGMEGIVIDGLVRVFKGGIRAVDGIDLEVAPGEIYGFLGPNGAG